MPAADGLCVRHCPARRGGEPDPVPDEEKVAVSFNSTINLETKAGATKADPLADGRLVDVYAYQQNSVATPMVAAVVSRSYTVSGGNGNLTVTGGESVMLLAAGNYTFYALSTNAETTPSGLAAGSVSQTAQLANNTDYIYCATNKAIDSKPGETQSVSLPFLCLSTRLVITIVSEGGDDKITAAAAPSLLLAATNPSNMKITLGDPDRPANILAPGTPVGNKDNYTTVQSIGTANINDGFTASYIMLPMQAGQTIPVIVTFPRITFNGLVQTNKIYELTITTPEGGFASGNQYNYKVNITGNEIAFKGVSVSTWTGKNGSLPNGDITEDW